MSEQTIFVVDDDEAVLDALSITLDTVGLPFKAYLSAQAFLDDYHNEPGCLVLDIRMPNMSGVELQQHLIDHGALLPIIFVTGHGDIPLAVETMRKGAVDFIRKPYDDEELLSSIREALARNASARSQQESQEASQRRIDSLSPREKEVFVRVASGQANKVVAIELKISERTVEIHRSQVMRKTGCRTLTDLVRLEIAANTPSQ